MPNPNIDEVQKDTTKVEEKPTETKVEETKVEETKTEEKPTEDKVEETKTEDVEDKTEETQPTEDEQEDVQGNGIPIDQVVLKEELNARLASLESKLDALIKENTDLKQQLADSKEETKSVKNKYENGNFGGYGKSGVIGKDKVANDSFEEYSKQFM